jgi:retinol-binding protein 3
MSARVSRTLVALLCAMSASSALAQNPTPAGAQRVAIPNNTPIGRSISQWLDALNSGDTAQLRAYYKKYSVERDMSVQATRMAATGGYDLVSIEKNEPRLLELVLKERKTGNLAYAVLELKDDDDFGMKQTALYAVPRNGSIADFKIDAAGRARVIESAAAKLDTYYVFPDVAAKMAADVRGRMKRGEYDRVTNGITFANLLTEHFRSVSHDLHLGVGFSAPRVPDPRPGQTGPDSAARERYRVQMASMNCGFQKVEMLPGNTGYLKFNFFADPEACGPTATAAMSFVANADALIIDLRENGGGSPEMVAYISSYLFSKRTHLNDLWTRRTNETREYWTRPELPGKKLGDDKPIYVLTASRTFSGAEEFSNNLKVLKRATIVGETTGGGAHPVSGHKIDEHFTMGVPFARAINPITRTNWEGTGVEPDVKVPASDALGVAQKLIAEKTPRP